MDLAKTAQNCLTDLEYRLQRAKYALRGKSFSRSREQQILWKYINQLLPPTHAKTVVDIGAGNGLSWSNTYSLFLKGWHGVGIEADRRKFSRLERAYRDLRQVRACHARADPYNIVPLLKSCDVVKNFSVLSLDIDGNDYWVLSAILKEFRPVLIVTEINEKIPPPLRFVVKFDPDFQLRHHFYGYSIAALEDFCEHHGYGILELEYNNAFLAPREFGNNLFVNAESAYKVGYLDRVDQRQRFASNLDLEIVQSLGPLEAIDFLRDFYGKEAGKYFLAPDKGSFQEVLSRMNQNE